MGMNKRLHKPLDAEQQERLQPVSWWLVDFATTRERFGSVVVMARGPIGAEQVARVLQLHPEHPNCEVMATQLSTADMSRIPENFRNRLFTAAELLQYLEGKGI